MYKVIFFFLFFINPNIYADVSLDPNLECCMDIVYKLNEQNEFLIANIQLSENNQENLSIIKNEVINLSKSQAASNDFWHNWGGRLLIALLTSFVTIFIFVCGILYAKRKERRRKKVLLKAISLFLKKIVRKCDTAINNIKDYNNDIKNKPWNSGRFTTMSMGESARLKEMNIDTVSDAFFEFKIDSNKFVEYYADLDHFHTLIDIMEKDYFNHSLQVVTSKSNLIFEAVAPFQKAIYLYADSLYKNTHIVYGNSLIEILETFNANYVELDIDSIIKLLVDRTKKVLADIEKNKIEIPLQLYQFSMDMTKNYKHVVDNNKKFSSMLQHKIENINQCKISFEKIVKDIENKTL